MGDVPRALNAIPLPATLSGASAVDPSELPAAPPTAPCTPTPSPSRESGARWMERMAATVRPSCSLG